MKLIIAGGRNYSMTDYDRSKLDGLHAESPITEVVSGGATGADAGGERWAESHGIPIKIFLPDWKAHGKSAGPMRNREMARYADAAVLFPGGAGTNSMRLEAHLAAILIFDWR